MTLQRNRGALIRRHRSGISVCMYNDDPGVYFAKNGDPVSPERAREAGFDIERHAKEREDMKKRQQFERTLSDGASAMFDRTGVKVVDGDAPGTYKLVSNTGVELTGANLSKEQAEVTYRSITGQDLILKDPEPKVDDAPAEKPAPKGGKKKGKAAEGEELDVLI